MLDANETAAPSRDDLQDWLSPLYGERAAAECVDAAAAAAVRHGLPIASETSIDAAFNVLITYADIVQRPGESPLATLRAFMAAHLADAISAIHILPFFPESSDDGFSVMDYRAVHPELGDWDDVSALAADHPLMFDLVLNHASRKGQWFANYLGDTDPGRDYFIEVDPKTDLRAVVRPRARRCWPKSPPPAARGISGRPSRRIRSTWISPTRGCSTNSSTSSSSTWPGAPGCCAWMRWPFSGRNSARPAFTCRRRIAWSSSCAPCSTTTRRACS